MTSVLNTFLESFSRLFLFTSFLVVFGVIEPARGALQSYYGSLGSDVSVVFVMIEKNACETMKRNLLQSSASITPERY